MFTHRALSTHNNKKGFTLVETMVALAVLTIAIIPVLYLSNSSVNVAYDIRDDLIGSGLAQEGIEVIRGIRDTDFFNAQAFGWNLLPGTYQVEWNSTSLSAYTGSPLNLNNNQYTYTGGTPTKFTRSITITKISNDELKIVSQVSWPTQRGTKTISAEDHLYNWQ